MILRDLRDHPVHAVGNWIVLGLGLWLTFAGLDAVELWQLAGAVIVFLAGLMYGQRSRK